MYIDMYTPYVNVPLSPRPSQPRRSSSHLIVSINHTKYNRIKHLNACMYIYIYM